MAQKDPLSDNGDGFFRGYVVWILHHTIWSIRILFCQGISIGIILCPDNIYNMGILCYCNIMLSGYYVVVLSIIIAMLCY